MKPGDLVFNVYAKSCSSRVDDYGIFLGKDFCGDDNSMVNVYWFIYGEIFAVHPTDIVCVDANGELHTY